MNVLTAEQTLGDIDWHCGEGAKGETGGQAVTGGGRWWMRKRRVLLGWDVDSHSDQNSVDFEQTM